MFFENWDWGQRQAAVGGKLCRFIDGEGLIG